MIWRSLFLKNWDVFLLFVWQEIDVFGNREVFLQTSLLCFGLGFSQPGFVVVSGFWELGGSSVPVCMGTELVRPWAHWGPSKGLERGWRWGRRASNPNDVSAQGLHGCLLEALDTLPWDSCSCRWAFSTCLFSAWTLTQANVRISAHVFCSQSGDVGFYGLKDMCFMVNEAIPGGSSHCGFISEMLRKCSKVCRHHCLSGRRHHTSFGHFLKRFLSAFVSSFLSYSSLPVLGTVLLLLLVTWEWCWRSKFTYLSQLYFLSSQIGFITGPSFLKCNVFTAKSHLIIIQWHLSQDIAFPVISITCFEAPSDIFLHNFHSPVVLEEQPDLHICLPHPA